MRLVQAWLFPQGRGLEGPGVWVVGVDLRVGDVPQVEGWKSSLPPLQPLEGTIGVEAIGEEGLGPAAWPLQPDSLCVQSDPAVLTSSPWMGGSQPHRVPHGKDCEAAPFFCP